MFIYQTIAWEAGAYVTPSSVSAGVVASIGPLTTFIDICVDNSSKTIIQLSITPSKINV